MYSKDVTLLELKEDEKDATIVERDGQYYLVIRTDPEKGEVAFMNHIPFKKIEDNKE